MPDLQDAKMFFIEPVDPVALRCPDYSDFVKKPMSLSVVMRKLGSGPGQPQQYSDPADFIADMRQVCSIRFPTHLQHSCLNIVAGHTPR